MLTVIGELTHIHITLPHFVLKVGISCPQEKGPKEHSLRACTQRLSCYPKDPIQNTWHHTSPAFLGRAAHRDGTADVPAQQRVHMAGS